MKTKKILGIVLAMCLCIGMFFGLSVVPAGAANASFEKLTLENVGLTQPCVDASLMSMGNSARIARVMQRAARGEEITLGFIGGSITWGAGCIDGGGTVNDRFSNLVQAWFEDRFPQATVNMINVGIPSTGSLIGTFRFEDDLLQHEPDLIVIEYAVNDGSGSWSWQESTEAMVRNAFALENDPAVMLFMMCTGQGWGSQDDKKIIGEYYQLPMVSYKNGVYYAINNGIAEMADFDGDGIHPSVNGNAAAALFIINWLEEVYKIYDTVDTTIPAMPDPMYSDKLSHVTRLSSKNFTPTQLGSFKPSDSAGQFDCFMSGWIVDDGGKDALTFEVNATRIYLPYYRNPFNDGVALVSVNGVPVATLSGYATSYETYIPLVYESDVCKTVQVTIQMISGNSFALSNIWVAN